MFAEQQQSDQGKSPNALAVEHRLNQLQGQTMCEACHSGIVARNHGCRNAARLNKPRCDIRSGRYRAIAHGKARTTGDCQRQGDTYVASQAQTVS